MVEDKLLVNEGSHSGITMVKSVGKPEMLGRGFWANFGSQPPKWPKTNHYEMLWYPPQLEVKRCVLEW